MQITIEPEDEMLVMVAEVHSEVFQLNMISKYLKDKNFKSTFEAESNKLIVKLDRARIVHG